MIDSLHLLVLAALVFLFGLGSRAFGNSWLTAPLAFVAFGMLLAPTAAEHLGVPTPFGKWEHLDGAIHLMGEITLVILLFTDASQIELRRLRLGARLPERLLLIGMPATVVLGAAAAMLVLPELLLFEALLLGSMLAPTDAALGQSVVTNYAVPLRIRQGLTVESGLNDGLAVPMVVVFSSLASIGMMQGGETLTTGHCVTFAAKQLVFGPLVGGLVGWLGSAAMSWSIHRGYMAHAFQQLAGIMMAILSYVSADLVGGNGFIAAFVGGLVLGNSHKQVCACLQDFSEAEGQLLMLVTFFLVGLGIAWEPVLESGAGEWGYALCSLTLIRLLPVGLSLLGLGLRWESLLFVGWFGPRGLASILFAVLILESSPLPHGEIVTRVAVLTVLLSTLLHGVSAAGWSRGYARRTAAHSHSGSYELGADSPGEEPTSAS